MKLTPAQIEKIEAVVTAKQEGMTGRGIIIEFGVSSLEALSAFFGVLRDIGIPVTKHNKGAFYLSSSEKAAFEEYLAAKKAQRSTERASAT